MKVYEVTLQELVQWALLAGLVFVILLSLLRSWRQRRSRRNTGRCRRKCAQCGLLQEMGPSEGKYGVCQVCRGVTVRGRSRKLG